MLLNYKFFFQCLSLQVFEIRKLILYILNNIAGKFAYEAGNTLGSITTSFVIGYLNKFRSGAEAVADLVDEKR